MTREHEEAPSRTGRQAAFQRGRYTVKDSRKVCVVLGDDASPEVVRPTVGVVEKMGLPITFSWAVTGEDAAKRYGDIFPAAAKRAIDGADCSIMGSTRSIRGVHGYLRWGKECYANIRPAKYFKGLKTSSRKPAGIDFVIVRENLEGLYPAGWEGEISQLRPLGLVSEKLGTPLSTDEPGRFAVKVTTEKGTRRICRSACKLAMDRKRKGGPGKLTVASKYNGLECDEMFRSIAEETCKEFPELSFNSLIIDNFCYQMILNPHQFDVVVMSNEYGDILADGASALVGGLGIAPNACIGDNYAYFGSVHGTAPDIVGLNVINPTAMILGAAMMLDYLGFADASAKLESAVRQTYARGECLTRDQGGTASTTEFCDYVARLSV